MVLQPQSLWAASEHNERICETWVAPPCHKSPQDDEDAMRNHQADHCTAMRHGRTRSGLLADAGSRARLVTLSTNTRLYAT